MRSLILNDLSVCNGNREHKIMFTEKIHSMWLPVHVTSCVRSCVCVIVSN